MDRKTTKKAVHIILMILIVVVIVSGLGITYYRSIEYITGGLLDKTFLSSYTPYSFCLSFWCFLYICFFSWLWPKKRSR